MSDHLTSEANLPPNEPKRMPSFRIYAKKCLASLRRNLDISQICLTTCHRCQKDPLQNRFERFRRNRSQARQRFGFRTVIPIGMESRRNLPRSRTLDLRRQDIVMPRYSLSSLDS